MTDVNAHRSTFRLRAALFSLSVTLALGSVSLSVRSAGIEKVERTYQEMKGELGLDHFEGRSFIGWHHHVSVVPCCYAFVVAERVRRFPPSRGCADRDDALERAA